MTFSIDQIIEDIKWDHFSETTGKRKLPKYSYPCGLCKKNVLDNQKAVQYDSCDQWIHTKCNGMSDDDYNEMIENTELHQNDYVVYIAKLSPYARSSHSCSRKTLILTT